MNGYGQGRAQSSLGNKIVKQALMGRSVSLGEELVQRPSFLPFFGKPFDMSGAWILQSDGTC